MLWSFVGATLVVVLLVGWLFAVGSPQQRVGLVLLAVIVLPVAAVMWTPGNSDPVPETPATSAPPVATVSTQARIPEPNREAGYVSAETCRECHPDHHQSWYETYHRTMTQKATPEAVVPSFDDVTLTSRGRQYHLMRKGDEFWVDTVDPSAEMMAFIQGVDLTQMSQMPRAERQIVMTTGSHYHQTYWMQNPNGTLIQFPWVYHINTDRWVYRIDSFLRPPNDKVTFNIWNMHCLGCHSTGGEPRVNPHDKSMFSVGELGVSCEACHGPGEEHVRLARRSEQDVRTDPHIVNPRNCSAEVSAQICGQCHVIAERHDEGEFLAHGDPYRPGGEGFEAVRKVIRYSEDILVSDENHGQSLKSRFWPDGTVRTGGREYNGLIRSACYTEGEGHRQMSCLSCHSMHDYNSPSKLIAKGMETDQACTQCHTDPQYTERLAEHTHHAVDSMGSRCVNCHMPHTSYAIFAAIRSHRIQSPSVRAGARGARPNACNLCHLDKTKGWAAEKLADWYDIEAAEVTGDEAEVAAGLLWALKGDAAQRAVAAWHMRWEPARQAAGAAWMPAVLAELLTDTYPAVRYVAYESLRTHAGFEDLKYDFDGPPDVREAIRQTVLAQWQEGAFAPQSPSLASRLLMDAGGRRQRAEIRRL
ncbi:MAG: multiheme c-type cytochrome, partial [Maioricimonas sp. JB049]